MMFRSLERNVKMNSMELFKELYGGRASRSGRSINWRTALEVSTALCCCRVLGEGVAQVPWQLMQQSGKNRTPATDHPLYDVLFRKPNPWQTSFEFRETMVWHAALCGNAYALITKPLGRVTELILFEPQWVWMYRLADGSLQYEVTIPEAGQITDAGSLPGRRFVVPGDQMWHVKGPSWNGFLGLETIRLAREALGLALATEEAHARLHSNGVRTSGTYSVEGTLGKDQEKSLREYIEKWYAGGENSSRPMILDRNAKWLAQAMTGVDAQHLETRNMQIAEVCRTLRVMPIMVGHSDKTATYASAEQMFLAHLVHTMSPWYERLEQSADVNLLSDKERKQGLFTNFDEESLQRASLKEMKDYLLGLVNGGLITPNEGRISLNRNPMADAKYDDLREPTNITGDANGGSSNTEAAQTGA